MKTCHASLQWLKLVLSFIGLATGALASLAPVSDFVKRPEVSSVMISEDGRFVAFLTPNKDTYFDLNLYDLQTKESKKFDLKGDEVLSYAWIDATRLVLTTQHLPRYWYRQQVFDMKEGKATANLSYDRQYFSLISSLRRDPDLFIARFYEESRFSGGSAGLAIINTRLRPSSLAGKENNRFNVKEWIKLPRGELHTCITDEEGELRFVTLYAEKKLSYYYRAKPNSEWIELPFEYETTTVLGFTDDPDLIYVAQYTADAKTSRLHRYRISTKDFGAPLFSDSEYSISEAHLTVRRQPDGKTLPLSLGYHRDVYVQRAIHPTFAAVQESINKMFPGRLNTIYDCDYNLKHFIIASANGREPQRFIIYNHATKDFVALPAPTPWFKAAEMSVQRPIKFTTRDGLILEGYLSLPTPPSNGQKPPLVVYAHGGPWVRDTWGFDTEVQFLTSRGYAVFQPNYRGSSGYSKVISKDDDFEFRKMHNDVTDGVRNLVDQGLVDSKRMAIYGGSFGGYLAIAGAAFEPGLYRCAITFAGVFDWKQMINQRRRDRDENEFVYDLSVKKMGDPATQVERFEAMSPINQIAAIKCPVFVIHGKLDSTVDYEQSTRLLSRLAAQKIPHEKLFFDTEYHGLNEPKNYQKFLGALEKFLAKNL